MEKSQKVELLEKRFTALEENMEELGKEINDLKINLKESEREREMLEAENILLVHELAKQNNIRAELMNAKENEIKKKWRRIFWKKQKANKNLKYFKQKSPVLKMN